MESSRTHCPSGTDRKRSSRAYRYMTGLLAALMGAATLVAVTATPASAATVNGIAVVTSPGTTTPLTTGGSTTQFTVSLPPQSACSGDTATHGYHVYSYLLHKGAALSGVTFVNFPSSGYGFVDSTGTYYGPANTAIGTGQIISVPNNLEWAPLVTSDSIPLSTLLYTGSGSTASGVWSGGLVCANTSGVPVDNWSIQLTFSASSTDPHGFTWKAKSSKLHITTASLPVATQGKAYSATLVATGAKGTLTWSSNVKLPKGLKLNAATGAITGTTSATATVGTFPIVFTANDTKNTTTATVSIQVKA